MEGSEGKAESVCTISLLCARATTCVVGYASTHGRRAEVEVGAWFRIAVAEIALISLCPGLRAQVGGNRKFQTPQTANPQGASGGPDTRPDSQAEQELQKGTALTKSGLFAEAIPHLRAALGRVANEYAASFNLSLSLVATGQAKPAIPILTALRDGGHDSVDVNNLLAQAYVGDGQTQKALVALQRAAKQSPDNEKLYLFVADACMAKPDYDLGLQVVSLGLDHLHNSARLHYQRGMFLTLQDKFDAGKKDFDQARDLAPGTDIAYLADTQRAMLEGDIKESIRIAREAVKKGYEDYRLLTLLGEALLRSGIAPGEPEFREAQAALEKSAVQRPNFAGSQLALGKLALLDNRTDEAIAHLEIARKLNANEASVYSNLAVAYRRRGDLRKAQSMLAVLAGMNQAQAERFRSAPEDKKPGYAASAQGRSDTVDHP
jgi:tetratricopeptide (TPR) repeat protein